MVNYQALVHEQFNQIASAILLDVCESYWPMYVCPVFEGVQGTLYDDMHKTFLTLVTSDL